MRCEKCPAGWEDRSYEGECNDCGCLIMGHGIFDSNCKLTSEEIKERLHQLKEYEAGRIKRPQWIVNRFMRELDTSFNFIRDGVLHTSYPPERMTRGVYYPVYGSLDMKENIRMGYRHGYEDAKGGKPYDEESV